VWAYSNTEALLGVQQTNYQESLAGVAFPEYGLITAAVPEGNTRELGRVIPHEVSHLVLNQVAANPFGLPPLWLDEGLAVYYQESGKENYQRAVQRALAEDRLFALSSLAASFPLDPESAYVAYAQSLSAVTFLLERYGASGMARFVECIGAGLTTDEAMTAALGVDLPTFERAWHQAVRAQGQQSAPLLDSHKLDALPEPA
ncbi:MAG: peptidase MA family metallohydrolase, partial [Chloroflexota bacterium]|nr:peptidase MA family metallohydrolase [Chloroflexota bacterium]